MKFKIINLSYGSQKDCSFENLSTSLFANCVILRAKEEGFESIGLVTHHTLTYFAVEFASYALQNYTKKIIPEAQTCIDLTRKWLEDQSSVSVEELKATADAAKYAANAAYYDSYAAYAASNAAYAAYAAVANAAYAASNAAYAYATDAASNAAYAYATDAEAAGKNKLDEQNRQGTFILNFFGVE